MVQGLGSRFSGPGFRVSDSALRVWGFTESGEGPTAGSSFMPPLITCPATRVSFDKFDFNFDENLERGGASCLPWPPVPPAGFTFILIGLIRSTSDGGIN